MSGQTGVSILVTLIGIAFALRLIWRVERAREQLAEAELDRDAWKSRAEKAEHKCEALRRQARREEPKPAPGKRYPRASCEECGGTGQASALTTDDCPECMISPKPARVPEGAPWSVSVDGLGRKVAIWWNKSGCVLTEDPGADPFAWNEELDCCFNAGNPILTPALAADCKAFYEAVKKDGGL